MVAALRLAPEPSLNKPPTEAQYAPEALQLQDHATLNHAQVHYNRICRLIAPNCQLLAQGGNGDGEQPDPACTETYHADGFVCKREKGQAKTDCKAAKKTYNSKRCREVRKQLGM